MLCRTLLGRVGRLLHVERLLIRAASQTKEYDTQDVLC